MYNLSPEFIRRIDWSKIDQHINDVVDVVDELNREVCRLNKVKMYSEEVVLKLLEEYEYDLTLADNLFEGSPKQWFEQFKKKVIHF